MNDVRLFGPEDGAGIVSFALEGIHPHDLGTILDEENVAIPDLPALAGFVRENIPGSSEVTNPLDATGFAWSDPDLWERIVEANTYISELSGAPKKKESWLDLLMSLRVLREQAPNPNTGSRGSSAATSTTTSAAGPTASRRWAIRSVSGSPTR